MHERVIVGSYAIIPLSQFPSSLFFVLFYLRKNHVFLFVFANNCRCWITELTVVRSYSCLLFFFFLFFPFLFLSHGFTRTNSLFKNVAVDYLQTITNRKWIFLSCTICFLIYIFVPLLACFFVINLFFLYYFSSLSLLCCQIFTNAT